MATSCRRAKVLGLIAERLLSLSTQASFIAIFACTLGILIPEFSALADVPRRSAEAKPPSDVVAETSHDQAREPVLMSDGAKSIKFKRELFSDDPAYADKPYDPEAQLQVYGGKTEVLGPRPPIEWGYPMYQVGDIGPGITIFGEKNPARPELLVYGDLRVGTAYNKLGVDDTAQAAARLNLDVDLRITATERVHAFFRPLDRTEQARFSRTEFGGSQRSNGGKDNDFILDGTPESLFFEGDLGQILAGATGEYNRYDLPFSVGLVPLFFQNGIWMDDSVVGGAFTIPALNSPRLDISNMDFTFFAGLDKVTTRAVVDEKKKFDDHGAQVFGAAGFIDAQETYIELGYGFTRDRRDDFSGDFGYQSATAAITKRYQNYLSNSLRLIVSAGQDDNQGAQKTADGWLFLVENSLITSKPYTLVPYANFFVGHDHPQSLARDFAAGGPLKNSGINFETDGLTGFPKLDDSGNDTYGGVLGIEYLFALDQQLAFEVAGLKPFGSDNEVGRIAKGDQFAFGVRYQRPLSKNLIFRADAMYGGRENEEDLAGVRGELRLKF